MDISQHYRYVVVGGGSAGCLLARLLAEGQTDPVALIEAGKSRRDVRTVVPNLYPRTFGSSLDWGFTTEPQAGLADRRLAWPRGKLLGGSGAISAMIYLMAAGADYRRWGWTDAAGQTPVRRDPVGGIRCPLSAISLSPVREPHPWSLAFLEAARGAGLTWAPSLRQSQANSCGLYWLSQSGGRRQHTGLLIASALRDAGHSKRNLDVLEGCHAQKLSLERDRVRGVRIVDSQGQQKLVYADEVILCAGTIGSPVLLMRSGIGPQQPLSKAAIRCQVELDAVGSNLQDHLVFPVVYRAKSRQGLPRRHSVSERIQYRRHGTGSPASNIAEAGAFYGAGGQTEASDFQIHFTPTHYLKYPKLKTNDDFFSLGVTDLHPRSRGTIDVLATAPGRIVPRIDPRYLSDPSDVERLREAVAWARHLADQHGLREHVAQEVLPSSRRTEDPKIIKTIRKFAQSLYHPVGTCRMETPDAMGPGASVVDRQFRVHGLQGLRIADASVLPDLPSGNTNAVTLWVAFRAAQQLLA